MWDTGDRLPAIGVRPNADGRLLIAGISLFNRLFRRSTLQFHEGLKAARHLGHKPKIIAGDRMLKAQYVRVQREPGVRPVGMF